jgi:hypothetical protein
MHLISFGPQDTDIRHETFIARCVEILEQNTSVVLCYSGARWLEPDGRLGDVMSGHVETRGMSQVSRFRTVMWSLGGFNYPINGIMRSDALKRTSLIRNTIGPDVLLLHELALLGTFAEVPEPLLSIRRLPDYGSWHHLLAKIFGPAAERRSAWYLYSKMIYEHVRIVVKHTKRFREKVILVPSVILCMLTKYKWVLQGLRALPRSLDS